MSVLAALTPPFLVCAIVIAAIVAFLRHEMRRGRDDRSVDSEANSDPQAAARDGHHAGASDDADTATSARRDN